MNKVPFGRFIITFLLFNKGVPYIVDKLKSFGYNILDKEVSECFDYIRKVLPEKYVTLINARRQFDINDKHHIEWLKQFGVFEFYDYILRQDVDLEDTPEYFKWCKDCLWAHGHKDVMVLINILLFNGEEMDEISKIIMFKYRKKMGIETLELYKRVFWEVDYITAKEAFHFCMPFRDNALIIRHIRGGTEIEALDDESNDGSDVPFTFHDNNYIKWKIGYREIEVPSPRDFLQRVKTDSYYKYVEVMSMTQSMEIEEEEGTNDKIGAFDNTKIKKRNVEEQRAKLTKHWLDIYLKAHGSMPTEGGKSEENFFKKMDQMSLDFDGPEDEKIARVEDMPGVLDDIKGDMSSSGR